MYQSEIRDSEIVGLFEKVQKRNYGKYLFKISIGKARGYENKVITFDFPVTALIGPNGGGKTTVMGAAALAYKSIKPSLFFSKSGRFDESMQNWKFEFDVIDRDVKQQDSIKRTATFTNLKWSREALTRETRVFGVSRTVPATERPDLAKCMSRKFDVLPDRISTIPEEAARAVAAILDKDVAAFQFLKVDSRGKVTLLAGQTANGEKYSEFHFGAGESSIIRMVVALETMSDQSLVLIEEIENGLHPLATIRLVEYLVELAVRKKIQVIFTTHSNDALKPLPDKAIWAAVRGSLYQGKLDIASLRAISGVIDTRLAIFTEDKFAKSWVEEILRNIDSVALDAVGIYAMEGDGTAQRVHKDHNLSPASKNKAICILDGDSKYQESKNDLIFKLPGESPERYIFNQVLKILDTCSGELAVALLKPYEKATEVAEVIASVANTNRDEHTIFSQIGKRLSLIPEQRVREAFMSIWARFYSDDLQAFASGFEHLLPKESEQVHLGSGKY
ncbi:ATP-dependent nuclease [Pseudomonas aeruginosa]|uniref:ATP-dependent nuclease n=1 Tax=Pseudomonas aeruginosa TaxID=287 RepID=UPI00097E734C|nr:ATP-binding protein [Pseudomonas aeruginosa]ONM90952.1 AAA family ATPase [Pseudomonas aeruginosa]ONM95540.1 AAA family ATPase [Pseudomonas aeruginosa]